MKGGVELANSLAMPRTNNGQNWTCIQGKRLVVPTLWVLLTHQAISLPLKGGEGGRGLGGGEEMGGVGGLAERGGAGEGGGGDGEGEGGAGEGGD